MSKEKLTKALKKGSVGGICYCVCDEEDHVKAQIHAFMVAELKKRGWYDDKHARYPIKHPIKDAELAYAATINQFSLFSIYTWRRRIIAKLILKEFYND